MQATIQTAIEELFPSICDLRCQIHRCPELGNEEIQTTHAIREFLETHGVRVETFSGRTGAIAHIDAGKPHTVGFRADIDALPVEESTGVAFTSQRKGVMHACGHDVHAAIAAGLAVLMERCKKDLPVNVRILFQPAEECNPEGGAKRLIACGALEGLDYIMGLHVWPELPQGVVGVRPGFLMAASDKFSVKIRGKKSHAAAPHKGVDAIAVGNIAVSMIKNILIQEVDPRDTAVISIGEFNSGGRYNIISNEVDIKGTVRTFDPELREHIHTRIREILIGLDTACRVTHELTLEKGYNSVCNDKRLAAIFIENTKRSLGEEMVDDNARLTLVGEDFSFYGQQLPSLFFFLGAGCPHPLHSDLFLPAQGIIKTALIVLCEHYMKPAVD